MMNNTATLKRRKYLTGVFQNIRLDRIRSADPFLFAAILFAAMFGAWGIQWGRVEDWHADQMVYGRAPFEELSIRPINYQKPPFHAYFSLIVRLPAKAIAFILNLSPAQADAFELIAVRLLTVAMFTGCVVLSYQIMKRSFGLFPARFLALVLSTSAGFIAFSHFLTVDIPVTFWMLLALFFALRILYDGRPCDYILAGFFTGIATATKYNGVGIGISIAVAHLLAIDPPLWRSAGYWRRLLISRNLWASFLMIPAGFLLGNPYILVDFRRFVSDFMYNTTVTPVYRGTTTGTNYLEFFAHIGQLVGLPALLLFSAAFLYSLYVLVTRRESAAQRKILLVLLSALVLYYMTFGSLPRLLARWVLPVTPALLLMAGPFLNSIRNYKWLVSSLLVIILGYNFYCSYLVGLRFLNDPRMLAQEWAMKNIPQGSSVENSSYIPDWNKLEDVQVQESWMPSISGRNRLFQDVLGDNPWVNENLPLREAESQEDINWFTEEQLLSRQPDYVAVDSRFYGRFFENPYYPTIDQFFVDLLSEKTCYRIVFHAQTGEVPVWVYPQAIDNLANTLIILQNQCGPKPSE